MSHRIPTASNARLAIAMDVRRGEIYLEIFDRHSLVTLAGPRCVSIAEAVNLLGPLPVTVAGSGGAAVAAAAREVGIDAKAILPDLMPDALDVLFPAVELPVSATVRPLYLRPPDAKPPPPSTLFGSTA